MVYAITPRAASRYRDRRTLSGAKSDPGNAKMLAELVRTDRQAVATRAPKLPNHGPHRTLPKRWLSQYSHFFEAHDALSPDANKMTRTARRQPTQRKFAPRGLHENFNEDDELLTVSRANESGGGVTASAQTMSACWDRYG